MFVMYYVLKRTYVNIPVISYIQERLSFLRFIFNLQFPFLKRYRNIPQKYFEFAKVHLCQIILKSFPDYSK